MEEKCITLDVKFMFKYIDVLEQFNIESFSIDILDCLFFLFLIVFFGGLFFYDI